MRGNLQLEVPLLSTKRASQCRLFPCTLAIISVAPASVKTITQRTVTGCALYSWLVLQGRFES